MPALPAPTVRTILVIGYGNPLRGDDAVGLLAAQAIAAWRLPHVRVQAEPQLTPELAEKLAYADAAIFLDARQADGRDEVMVDLIEPTPPALGIGHTSDPRFLLALAATVFGRAPRAWLVALPAVDFRVQEGLSPIATRGLEQGLELLRSWLAQSAPKTLAFEPNEPRELSRTTILSA